MMSMVRLNDGGIAGEGLSDTNDADMVLQPIPS
jgi:hypothetical protein